MGMNSDDTPSVLLAGMFFTLMLSLVLFGVNESTLKADRYKACIAHHTPAECEGE